MTMDWDKALEVAKYLVPAIAGLLLTLLKDRRADRLREQQAEEARREDLRNELTAVRAEMTSQAREIFDRLQTEATAAKAETLVARERIQRLEQDLSVCHDEREMALGQLTALRRKIERKRP